MKKLILLFTLFIVGITYGQNLPIGAVTFKGVTTTKGNTLSTTSRYPVFFDTTLNEFMRWNGSAYEKWDSEALAATVTNASAITTIQGEQTTQDAAISLNTAKTSFSNLTGEVTSVGAATTISVNAIETTNILDGTIDETDLDTSVNASLDLADSSIQTADINTFTEINTIVADVDLVNASSFTTPNLLKYARFSGENTLEGLTGAAVFTDIITTGSIGATQLASTAVTPGSYTATNLTVDADGRITAASNGAGGGDDVSTFAEKTGALVGTDRLVGLSGATDFNETISGIPLSIFNDDLTHTAASTDDQTAVEVPITDAGVIITATDVEGALQENRTAIDLNTAKVTNATHTGDVTGATALTIGADKILESHLKAVNTPTDEYVLTYESTTGDFEWQVDSGGTPEDTAYGVGWNADVDAASKNSIYDEMETRVDSDVTGVTGADVIDNLISLTQDEYDAITPDTDTFYVITDAVDTLYIEVPLSDFTTVQTGSTTVAKYTMRAPYAMTLLDIRGSVATAGTTAAITMDVHDGATTIMTTNKVTIDATETSSETAATAPALTDTTIADDAILTFYIDIVDTGGTGLGYAIKLYYKKT